MTMTMKQEIELLEKQSNQLSQIKDFFTNLPVLNYCDSDDKTDYANMYGCDEYPEIAADSRCDAVKMLLDCIREEKDVTKAELDWFYGNNHVGILITILFTNKFAALEKVEIIKKTYAIKKGL